MCLLADLGFDVGEVTRKVLDAHAEPETDEQRQFVRRYSDDSQRP
jgi:hypothetical protein